MSFINSRITPSSALPVLLLLWTSLATAAQGETTEQIVAECDRLAASPSDPEHKAKGVEFKDIDATAAITACGRVVRLISTPRLQFQFGRSLLKGEEYNEAFIWLRKAAEQGLGSAQSNLGVLYSSGRGVTKSYEEAVRWYHKAAEQNIAVAQSNVGWMYTQGKGVAKNDEEAARWYRKSADQGHADAQYALGWMYTNGKGVAKNDDEAVRWYRKSADQGNENAQKYLAAMGFIDNKIDDLNKQAKDIDEQTEAVNSELATTQFSLGVMYLENTPPDPEKAREAFLDAAERNHQKAQYRVGMMYLTGAGGPGDETEAGKWLLKAAEQGYAKAQYVVGHMYLEGEAGVQQNKAEARRMFFNAATQGLADASFWLGMENSIMIKDHKAAYIWFDVASSQKGLTLGYKSARDNRDASAAKLDAATLIEAKKIAKEYRALNASEGIAAQSSDDPTIEFSQPTFAQHLMSDRHERVEIQGLRGLYYGLAAYLNGVNACPALLDRSVDSLERLSEPASIGLLIRIFEARLKMDEARDTSELLSATFEGPVLLVTMTEAMASGRFDVDALVSARGCRAPETARFVAAAERLAEALLVVSERGEKPYQRPSSLAGLPEETQLLFDEYYLCRVRTRTFHMVPGGAQDPCDDALFSFSVSEARATGKPIPTRSFVPWQGGEGVVGKYEEHPSGVIVVIDEAPEGYTPRFDDSLMARLGSECVNCGKKDGWFIGYQVHFKLNHNNGKKGRLYKATVTRKGYSNWTEHGWILECDYYLKRGRLNTRIYWHKNEPGDEFFRRVPSMGRPLPKVLGVRDLCPVDLVWSKNSSTYI